jgi:hypothetical protein
MGNFDILKIRGNNNARTNYIILVISTSPVMSLFWDFKDSSLLLLFSFLGFLDIFGANLHLIYCSLNG